MLPAAVLLLLIAVTPALVSRFTRFTHFTRLLLSYYDIRVNISVAIAHCLWYNYTCISITTRACISGFAFSQLLPSIA